MSIYLSLHPAISCQSVPLLSLCTSSDLCYCLQVYAVIVVHRFSCDRNFQRMNDRILSKLADVSRSDSHDLSRDEVKQLGLDPVGDHAFLLQLIDLYSFDVELEPMGFGTCCPELC